MKSGSFTGFFNGYSKIRTFHLTETTDLACLKIYYYRKEVTTVINFIRLPQNSMWTDEYTDVTTLAEVLMDVYLFCLPSHGSNPETRH